MRRWKIALFGTIAAVASFSASACYTVYDRAGQIVYMGSDAPVDMTLPIHEAMASRYPGGHLTFDTVTTCENINVTPTRQLVANMARPTMSPLLTDERTAERMHVRHTVVAQGIALVAPQQMALPASINVVPSETTLAAARTPQRDVVIITEAQDGRVVDTRVLGAGPAPKHR